MLPQMVSASCANNSATLAGSLAMTLLQPVKAEAMFLRT